MTYILITFQLILIVLKLLNAITLDWLLVLLPVTHALTFVLGYFHAFLSILDYILRKKEEENKK
jgi:hypothetical protein